MINKPGSAARLRFEINQKKTLQKDLLYSSPLASSRRRYYRHATTADTRLIHMTSGPSLLLLFLLCAALLPCNSAQTCSAQDKTCREIFPPKRTFVKSMLSFVATAIRKKSLVVMEVDIYHVAVYLSQKKIDAYKSKKQDLNTAVGGGADDVQAAIVLKFIRAVSADKVVVAIVEQLSSKADDHAYKAALDVFSKSLNAKIGPKGTSVDDEITFVFKAKSADEIGVSVNGNDIEWIKSAALRSNLLDIYAKKGRTVVPELVSKLEKALS